MSEPPANRSLASPISNLINHMHLLPVVVDSILSVKCCQFFTCRLHAHVLNIISMTDLILHPTVVFLEMRLMAGSLPNQSLRRPTTHIKSSLPRSIHVATTYLPPTRC